MTDRDTGFRHPLPEKYIDLLWVQPRIHKCEVTVLEQPTLKKTVFQVTFQNSKRLPLNGFLAEDDDGRGARGTIVIMKVGRRKPFVNMRARDSDLADWVLQR